MTFLLCQADRLISHSVFRAQLQLEDILKLANQVIYFILEGIFYPYSLFTSRPTAFWIEEAFLHEEGESDISLNLYLRVPQ